MSVRIQRVSRGYRLESSLWVPRGIDEVFAFFADARNLDALTPPWLRFTITTPMPVQMRPGLRLDYRLRIHGVPIYWQSEITVWDPPRRFVDEQRRGPYRRWVHEHAFSSRNGGTEVSDSVEYSVYAGFLLHGLFVSRDLRAVFAYRRRCLLERMG